MNITKYILNTFAGILIFLGFNNWLKVIGYDNSVILMFVGIAIIVVLNFKSIRKILRF